MAKSDHNGKRKPRGAARKRVPDLGYYVIVTDARETEHNYFNGLKESLPSELQNRIVIKVVTAKTDAIISKCKMESVMEPQYNEPWIVFDRDKVPRFDEIIAQAEKEKIHVGWSNPCIEIWFDAYFGQMHSYMDSVICCRRFAETFERVTGQEYKKADRHIYDILNRYGDQVEAIKLADQRMQSHERAGHELPSEKCPGSTVHHLVGEITSKVGGDRNELTKAF